MAAAPQFKVYTAQGEYVAACKYAEDAASVVANLGEGATIRFGHGRVVYRNDGTAGDSFDAVADIVNAAL